MLVTGRKSNFHPAKEGVYAKLFVIKLPLRPIDIPEYWQKSGEQLLRSPIDFLRQKNVIDKVEDLVIISCIMKHAK